MAYRIAIIAAFCLGILYTIGGIALLGLQGVGYAALGVLFLILGFVIEIAKSVKARTASKRIEASLGLLSRVLHRQKADAVKAGEEAS